MTNDNSILTSRALGDAALPQWLDELRDDAWGKLALAPLPSRLNEAWRFGDLKQADVSRFSHAEVPSPDELARLLKSLTPLKEEVLRFVLINGVLAESPELLPPGLRVMPFQASEFAGCDPSIDWNRFASGRFALLNQASLTNGLLLTTEEYANIEPVIEIVHAVRGDSAAIFPHTAINLSEGSSLRVLERHIDFGDGEHLAVGLQDIKVGKHASLSYALVQQMNGQSLAVEMGNTVLKEDARVEHFSSHCGSLWSRQELTTSLAGQAGKAEILSANLVSGNRKLDQRTLQDHLSKGAYSNLLYKNVLDDSAKTVFSGMIRVEQGAHETDSYQSNRNFILSDKAESNSLPGLEIWADNVRCSHGSSTASIDPEEVFYLRSRGITRETAEKLIAGGFLWQAVEKLESEEIKELLGIVLRDYIDTSNQQR